MGYRSKVVGLAGLLVIGAAGAFLFMNWQPEPAPVEATPHPAASVAEVRPSQTRALVPATPVPTRPADPPGLVRIRPDAPPQVAPPAPSDLPVAPSTAESPLLDIEQVARDVDAIKLMFRDFRSLTGENPVGTNADIMAAVMHDNPKNAKLGPPEGQQLNEKGELLDHWGTPYFFHQLSRDLMEIRSAGADKKLYTSDDIVIR